METLQNHVIAYSIKEKRKEEKTKYHYGNTFQTTQVGRAICLLHANPNLARRQDEVETRIINHSNI